MPSRFPDDKNKLSMNMNLTEDDLTTAPEGVSEDNNDILERLRCLGGNLHCALLAIDGCSFVVPDRPSSTESLDDSPVDFLMPSVHSRHEAIRSDSTISSVPSLHRDTIFRDIRRSLSHGDEPLGTCFFSNTSKNTK